MVAQNTMYTFKVIFDLFKAFSYVSRVVKFDLMIDRWSLIEWNHQLDMFKAIVYSSNKFELFFIKTLFRSHVRKELLPNVWILTSDILDQVVHDLESREEGDTVVLEQYSVQRGGVRLPRDVGYRQHLNRGW